MLYRAVYFRTLSFFLLSHVSAALGHDQAIINHYTNHYLQHTLLKLKVKVMVLS